VGLLVALLGLVIAGAGVMGVLRPRSLVEWVELFATPDRLYLAAGIRVGFGIILIGAAASCRAPDLVRLLGVTAVIAGVATPFVGVERVRRVIAWWTERSDGFIRAYSSVPILLGLFLLWAGL
jgi:hypothetical protein